MSPPVVRAAGYIVVVEGLLALAVAVVYLIHAISGANQDVVRGLAGAGWFGYGSAAWFGLVGAATTAGGVALTTGRRWGRGIAVFANLLLLGVAWYIFSADRIGYGLLVAAVALLTLGLLFSPSAVDWITRRGAPDDAD
jgi:hypothetical protein